MTTLDAPVGAAAAAGPVLLVKLASSVVLHAIRHIKLRLFAQGGVANPRNSGTIAVVYALP
ncbi:MAG TPA: hypothetical protein PLR78_13095 [Polaromonas sp.]|nr:hypothetical protein [Polaromonas sp.]HQS91950.1 hypothetical protein [Polaromonas sp.]